MSGVAETRRAVDVAGARCGDAVEAVEHARATADTCADWAVMMGLDAMHSVLEQATAAFVEGHVQWVQAQKACTAATTELATATVDAGRQDISGHLSTAAGHLAAASTAAAAAKARIGDATGHAAETQLNELITAAGTAAAMGETAAAAITAATRTLEALFGSNLEGDAGGSPPTGGHRPAVGQPERRPFKPIRPDPDKVAEIHPYLGLDYAVATLWDGDGNRVLGPHQADADGPAARARWRAPWRDYPRLRRHVEAHAAARMRTGEPKKMAMYINLPPCSYSDGCKLNVADLIPKGSTLYVHQVEDDGRGTRVHVFHGTGRALDD